jgi:uncharacterized delta-60 repeat protein
VDSSFNGNGFVLTDISSGSEDDATGLAIQTDGKIIVGGASDQSPALVRYNSNGSLDSTFNYDGKLVLNNINGVIISNWGSVAYMKVQVNGKILTGSPSGMVRLNPDGSVDNSFGNNGLKFLPAPMNDVAIQPDGKIVLAGGTSNFVIVRLDSNGAPDSSFANSGVETVYPYYVGCGTQAHQATSVVLQPDGRIIAAGYHWCCAMNDCRDFVLMRFNENGSLDSSFGQGGQEKTLMGFSSESHASAITPDLKLVLAGFAYDFDYGGLARYHLGTMLDVKNPPLASGDVIIAPNPTKDRITIKASEIENGTWYIEILDQTGRSLLREPVTVNNHLLQKEISLHRLEDGIYFLKMRGATRTMTYKVVKSE